MLIKRCLTLSLVLVLAVFVTITPVQALTNGDFNSLYNNTPFYDPSDSTALCGATGGSSVNVSLASADQVAIAKTIMGIAKTDGLDQSGALIGLMVALAESGLKIYANSSVPISLENPAKQAVGNNYDSVGVYQQRPSMTWSTIATGPAAINNKDAVWQLMDPAYSAEAFFGSPPGSKAPAALSKGLLNHSSWQSMEPWLAAQAVQASAYDNGLPYKNQMPAAQALLDKYWDTAAPVALPVSFKAATNTSSSQASWGSCTQDTGTNVDGYINPFKGGGWGLARTDQGVDYTTNDSMPVLAIGDGEIVGTDGSGWPGGVFLYYKLANGPFAGKCIYVAEHLADYLPAGTRIHAGQTIATALPGYPWTEWGWAQGPQTPSVPYNGLADGTPTEGGKAFARFVQSLGAKTLQDPGPGPRYAGATCQ